MLDPEAIRALTTALRTHHVMKQFIQNNTTHCLFAQAKFTEAEALHARSLAIREKVLGPEHHDVAASLGNYAGLLEHQVM